ncbi:hypothetical protein EF514_02120 [Anaerosphaera multitolerans]|uniref:Uncharacterized protein n=1 Tax=Anaerosphaera multitolerans TaxID=2487351 RepID=A0A437S9Q3_9FIRM|nr:hypothetical protein EF514_02120 [Anaerosphaera multitolerans]
MKVWHNTVSLPYKVKAQTAYVYKFYLCPLTLGRWFFNLRGEIMDSGGCIPLYTLLIKKTKYNSYYAAVNSIDFTSLSFQL